MESQAIKPPREGSTKIFQTGSTGAALYISTALCTKCAILMELYRRTPKEGRDYWLMTELFVMLHGSDVCDKAF